MLRVSNNLLEFLFAPIIIIIITVYSAPTAYIYLFFEAVIIIVARRLLLQGHIPLPIHTFIFLYQGYEIYSPLRNLLHLRIDENDRWREN